MQTISIRGKKYRVTPIKESGVFTELSGELIGGKILTDGHGGTLKIYDARTRDNGRPLLELICKEGRQENEEILRVIRRYDGGLAAVLEGENAEGYIYHEPFDIASEIHAIKELLENEFAPQWVHRYTELLDTAQTNKPYDEFPSKPNYLYVKSNNGTVTAKFDSPNEPSWTLTAKDQYRMPFQKLLLTWTAQAGKELVIYASNKEIKMSTLS